MLRFLCCGLLAIGLVGAVPEIAVAKDKGKPEHAQGNKPKAGNPGKGPKPIPPGQIKRYTRGAKLPAHVAWEEIGDLSNWKLPRPGKGNKYIKVDNEILEIAKDTRTVINAIGIVDDLMR